MILIVICAGVCVSLSCETRMRQISFNKSAQLSSITANFTFNLKYDASSSVYYLGVVHTVLGRATAFLTAVFFKHTQNYLRCCNPGMNRSSCCIRRPAWKQTLLVGVCFDQPANFIIGDNS